MPTGTIVGILNGISAGLLVIGGASVVLTLGVAGLCTMFSWLDMHVGSFVKKVFVAVILGGSMMGGAGAFGVWLSGQFGL